MMVHILIDYIITTLNTSIVDTCQNVPFQKNTIEIDMLIEFVTTSTFFLCNTKEIYIYKIVQQTF